MDATTASLPESLLGLTTEAVAERVARGQVNRVPRSDWADYRDILARNLLTLFNALVVPAGVALFWLGEYRGAWAVSAMAVINTLIGLAQEVRAKRHLDRLALLSEARARVLRDGAVHEVPSGDVVQDDVVLLAAGESVIADGLVLFARFLEVDEALLTGESDAVAHKPGDRLLSGSVCVAGDGAYRAAQVGPEAFAHRTGAQARRYRHALTPLQTTIDLLIRVLTGTAVVLCGLYVVLWYIRGFSDTELVQMVAATVTSMVPQGLVLMTTLAFTLGAVRMTARGALVQQLSAVEAMAAIDVLCMDKTGTLTTNQLRLQQVRTLSDVDEAAVRERLRLFAWTSVDERSKSVLALRAALGPRPNPAAELLDQIPFKSQNRFSAVRVCASGGEQVLLLGAWEALRTGVADPSAGELAWRDLLPTGLRVLLFAEADQLPSRNGSIDGLAVRPLALLALSDELRPEAGNVLAALAAQGIALKLLSGDNPETVKATIGTLDLPLGRESVVTGAELAAAPDRAALIRDRSVFGRVAPEQKMEIVTTLQAQGRRVAMLGDGVNDLLPVKRADLGIAMGEGSSATKTVAGLVLENNNFELLPATLDEGRILLRNLRRAAKLFLLKNVYTLFLIVMALGVLRLEFPYLPQQVTLLNALTIGVPAFLITLGRGRPPGPERTGFLREVGWFAVIVGLVMGGIGLAVLLVSAYLLDDDVRAQRTLLLTTLIVLGLGALGQVVTSTGRSPSEATSTPAVVLHGEAVSLRSSLAAILQSDDVVWWWVGLAVPICAVCLYWPLAADFFQLTPLNLVQWGVVAGASAAGLAVIVWRHQVEIGQRGSR